MTHDELHEELRGLMDSLDEHVEAEDAVVALNDLVGRIERTGLGSTGHDDEADESLDDCSACDAPLSSCARDAACCGDCTHGANFAPSPGDPS